MINLADAQFAEDFFLNLNKTWSWNLANSYLDPIKLKVRFFSLLLRSASMFILKLKIIKNNFKERKKRLGCSCQSSVPWSCAEAAAAQSPVVRSGWGAEGAASGGAAVRVCSLLCSQSTALCSSDLCTLNLNTCLMRSATSDRYRACSALIVSLFCLFLDPLDSLAHLDRLAQ